jgi:hypothetical protein
MRSKEKVMTDSEKQVVDFVRSLETVTLGRWMVNMQELSARLPANSRGFPNMCVSQAAKELRSRYRETTKQLEKEYCEVVKSWASNFCS